MGKRYRKPAQPPREATRVDGQALAEDLFRRGLITYQQAFDQRWRPREAPGAGDEEPGA